jgi:iron complex transport system substrate-binding protein
MRILSLSRVATELVCALGGVHLLVGKTDSCTYPESAGSIPSIGPIVEITQEKILIFEPDLIVADTKQQVPEGKTVFRIEPHTLEEVYTTIIALGALLEKQVEADLLVHDLRKVLEVLQEKSTHFRIVKVYFDSDVPMYLRELVAIAGGELYYDVHELDKILAFGPQMVFSFGDPEDEKLIELIEARPGWSALQAVAHERIFILDESLFRPTPRLAHGAAQLAKILHGIKMDCEKVTQ